VGGLINLIFAVVIKEVHVLYIQLAAPSYSYDRSRECDPKEKEGRRAARSLCSSCAAGNGPTTTGYSRFAECQGHSANAQKHSANTLPSVTLGIQHTALICRQTVVCRVFFIGHSANSLPSVSKHSAKINSRQKKIDGMERRCRFCRVHDGKHSAKFLNFAECQN